MPQLPAVASPTLLAVGLALIVIGWLMRRWASRHDLKDLAVGAAWDAAKGAAASGNLDAVKNSALASKVGEVMTETTTAGRAKRAAGIGVRGFIAQFVGIAGLFSVLAGLVAVAAGVFWK